MWIFGDSPLTLIVTLITFQNIRIGCMVSFVYNVFVVVFPLSVLKITCPFYTYFFLISTLADQTFNQDLIIPLIIYLHS